MKVIHKESAAGQWSKMSLVEQLANIGSEVSRTEKWRNKDKKIFQGAVNRALELFDLTLNDPRWKNRLREIDRAKELFCDAIAGGKEYKTSLEDLNRYFFNYGFCARQKAK